MKSRTGKRNKRKTRVGRVTSDRMEKSVIVEVTRTFRHPLYLKVVRRATKFKAHDEKNEARRGDLVQIMESRPRSKTKRWRMVRIIKSSADTERESPKIDAVTTDEDQSRQKLEETELPVQPSDSERLRAAEEKI